MATKSQRLFEIDTTGKASMDKIIDSSTSMDDIEESVYNIYLLRLCDMLKDFESTKTSTNKINSKDAVDYLIDMFDNYSFNPSASKHNGFKNYIKKFGLGPKSSYLSFAIKVENSLLNKYCVKIPINGNATKTPKSNDFAKIEDTVQDMQGMIYDATNADLEILIGPTKKNEFDKNKKMYTTRASLFDPHTASKTTFFGEDISLNRIFLSNIGLSSEDSHTPPPPIKYKDDFIETGTTYNKSKSDFKKFKCFDLIFMNPNPYDYSVGNKTKNNQITTITDDNEIQKYLWAKELGDTLQSFFITENRNKKSPIPIDSIICLTNDRGFTLNSFLSNANFVFSEKFGSSKNNNKKYVNYYYIKDVDIRKYQPLLEKNADEYINNIDKYITLLNYISTNSSTIKEIPIKNSLSVVLVLTTEVVDKIKDLSKKLKYIKKMFETLKDELKLDDNKTNTKISVTDQINIIKNIFNLFSFNQNSITRLIPVSKKKSTAKSRKSTAAATISYELPSVLSTSILKGSVSEINKFITEFKKHQATHLQHLLGNDVYTFVDEFITHIDTSPLIKNNTYIKWFGKYYNNVTKSYVKGGGKNNNETKKTKTTKTTKKTNNPTKEELQELQEGTPPEQLGFEQNEETQGPITRSQAKFVNDYTNADIHTNIIYRYIYENAFNKALESIISSFNIFSSYDEIQKIKLLLYYKLNLPQTLDRSVNETELNDEINYLNIFIDNCIKKNLNNQILSEHKLYEGQVENFEYDYIKYVKEISLDKDIKIEHYYKNTKDFMDTIYKEYYSKNMSLFSFRIYKQIFEEFISYKDNIIDIQVNEGEELVNIVQEIEDKLNERQSRQNKPEDETSGPVELSQNSQTSSASRENSQSSSASRENSINGINTTNGKAAQPENKRAEAQAEYGKAAQPENKRAEAQAENGKAAVKSSKNEINELVKKRFNNILITKNNSEKYNSEIIVNKKGNFIKPPNTIFIPAYNENIKPFDNNYKSKQFFSISQIITPIITNKTTSKKTRKNIHSTSTRKFILLKEKSNLNDITNT